MPVVGKWLVAVSCVEVIIYFVQLDVNMLYMALYGFAGALKVHGWERWYGSMDRMEVQNLEQD